MTKKLLLAAAAVGVLAFTGAATAGEITSTARTIASETKVPTGGFAGSLTSGTEMTNAVSIPAGASATYTVKYILTGATFDGAPAIASVGDADVNAQGGTVYIQTDGSAVAIITVTNSGTGAADLEGFSINAAVKVPAKADVKLASDVSVVNGSLTLPIDAAAATTVVNFKPLISGFVSTAGGAEAKLPNYTTFGGSDTDAQLASGIKLTTNAGTFHNGLSGAAIDADDVITGLTATISGPAGAQLDKLELNVGSSVTVKAGATDTSAVLDLDSSTLAAVLGSTGTTFGIDNTDEVSLNGVAYQIALAPTYAAAYSAAASFGPVAAGEVTLEGTNFIAPWFVLNNANNSGTLRLANNGTAATGPVFVTLKAHNGSAAPTNARVQVASSIAANGVLEVTGSTLAGLLGTTAQNGDLQVTIQGDGNVISGKVRIRNISGATFEQSLGNLNTPY